MNKVEAEVVTPVVAADKPFQPGSFYPAAARADDIPPPASVIATSEREAEHLRARGWQKEGEFFAARREQERIEREKAQAAEQLAAAALAEEERQRQDEIEKNKATQKVRAAAEAADQAKRDAHDAKVQFLISMSNARLSPLEELARRAGERFRAAAYAIGREYRPEEIERLARGIVAEAEQGRELKLRIDAIGQDYAKDAAALEEEQRSEK